MAFSPPSLPVEEPADFRVFSVIASAKPRASVV